jgi:hypothetical protein
MVFNDDFMIHCCFISSFKLDRIIILINPSNVYTYNFYNKYFANLSSEINFHNIYLKLIYIQLMQQISC